MIPPLSARTRRFQQATASVFRYFADSPYARRRGEPGVADFAIGNPHDMPLPAFIDAIQRWSAPQDKD